MSKDIDYYDEIKKSRKFFNEEDYEYSSEEILLMKETTNRLIDVIKKNPQTVEEFININYKILKKYGMSYFVSEKLENIADENINISKKDLLKLNKYCISLQSQGSINDYVSKHRKIDEYIWFNVVGILYPTINIEHKKIVKHMKNVRIKSIQRGFISIIIPKKILNDFLHLSDNNDLFCYVVKNGIKNKNFKKYLKENKILKNKEINFSFKKLEKSKNIICIDFDLKGFINKDLEDEFNIIANIVHSHSDQLSDDEIVKLALKYHKIKKMFNKETINVIIFSPYFYKKEDKFFIQRVTKTLKKISSN